MALQFARGHAAIEEAATSRGGGSFRPFVPKIEWQEDGESRYVLVLTPIEEVPRFLLHEWIPVGKGEKADGEEYTMYEWFISRKDLAIGEDYDDLEDRLEREAKLRHMAVMVELEPVVDTKAKGARKKVKGFKAKTDTYTRNDEDDGEVEVTQPSIGLCVGSAVTLYGALGSLDQSQGPLAELPVEITRRNKDKNTRYDIIPYIDAPVDLSPIVEYADGISYISDEMEDLVNAIESVDSDLEAAQEVAKVILDKRLEELADGERYEELVSPLKPEDMPKRFGTKKKGKAKPKRNARPNRVTRRQAAQEEATPEPEAEAPAKESDSKEDRFAALKARVESQS